MIDAASYSPRRFAEPAIAQTANRITFVKRFQWNERREGTLMQGLKDLFLPVPINVKDVDRWQAGGGSPRQAQALRTAIQQKFQRGDTIFGDELSRAWRELPPSLGALAGVALARSDGGSEKARAVTEGVRMALGQAVARTSNSPRGTP